MAPNAVAKALQRVRDQLRDCINRRTVEAALMTSSPLHDHIHSYLDEAITADALAELEHWIKSDPQHAQQFAQMILIHDRLRAELLTGEFLRNQAATALNSTPLSSTDLSSTTNHSAPAPRRSLGQSLLVTTALTIAGVMLIAFWQSSPLPLRRPAKN